MSYNPYSRELGQRVKVMLAKQMAGTGPKAAAYEKELMNELAPPCPGYLRSEVSLEYGSLQSIQFPILTSDISPNSGLQAFPTENRLRLADVFFVTVWRLALYKFPVSGGAYNAAIQSAGIAYTNPNPQAFTYNSGAALPALTQAAALNNLYNGKISVRIDTQTYYDSYPALDFRRVDYAQQGVGSSATSNVPYQFDTWNGPWYGGVPLGDSGFALSGVSTNIITLNMPQSINMGSAATSYGGAYATNAVFQFGGFLFQNASSLNKTH
jgi:hypothetical protein